MHSAVKAAIADLSEKRWAIEIVAPLAGGTLNQVFRVKANDVDAVLRVQTSDRLMSSAKTREFKVTRLASEQDIAPPLLAFDVELGYMLSCYVAKDSSTVYNHEAIDLMLALHGLSEKVEGPSIRDMLKGYLANRKDIAPTLLHEFDASYKALDGFNKVLCHLDPMMANVVGKGANAKLIDFEYSAMECPLIDIAMYASQHESTNDILRKFIAKGVTQPTESQWLSALFISALLEYAWYEAAKDQLDDQDLVTRSRARYLLAKQALDQLPNTNV